MRKHSSLQPDSMTFGAVQAVKLRKEWQKCTLGCPILDNVLNGGIPCGSITELAGESSAAKTQLCLQLLLAVQLPVAEGGLEGSALYIYTENYFASSRLRQLASPKSIAAREGRRSLFARPLHDSNVAVPKNNESSRLKSVRACFEKVRLQDGYSDSYDVLERPAKVPAIVAAQTRARCVSDPCKNIYVEGLQTAEGLIRYLDYAETLLSHPLRMPVRLLVVDSIAALFRADFTNCRAGLKDRGILFFQISSRLKQLAEKYDLAVIVSNHVTDVFEPAEAPRRNPTPEYAPTSADSDVLMTSGRRVVPALGISWAHCVNSRLFLSRVNRNPNITSRSMQVVFAPHLPNVSCYFLVGDDGVQGLPINRRIEDSQDYGEPLDYRYPVDGASASHIATAAVCSAKGEFVTDNASDFMAMDVSPVGGYGYVTP